MFESWQSLRRVQASDNDIRMMPVGCAASVHHKYAHIGDFCFEFKYISSIFGTVYTEMGIDEQEGRSRKCSFHQLST